MKTPSLKNWKLSTTFYFQIYGMEKYMSINYVWIKLYCPVFKIENRWSNIYDHFYRPTWWLANNLLSKFRVRILLQLRVGYHEFVYETVGTLGGNNATFVYSTVNSFYLTPIYILVSILHWVERTVAPLWHRDLCCGFPIDSWRAPSIPNT